MIKNCYFLLTIAYLMLTLSSCDKKQLENGYELVDLGLSVKWATCNVGANHPEEHGLLVGWSDVSGAKISKDYKDYPSAYGPMNISGDSRYDIACVKMGGNWRMPTYTEYQELVDNCTWKWTTVNGSNGYLITGANGNHIFLPAAGYRKELQTEEVGGGGYYWTGTNHTQEMRESAEAEYEQKRKEYEKEQSFGSYWDINYRMWEKHIEECSFALEFHSKGWQVDEVVKYKGCSVRGVCP